MHPSRRELFAGAALALASACTGSGTDGPHAGSSPDPAKPVLDAALRRERALLTAYDDALSRYPDLAPELAPLRADHLAHLKALDPRITPAPPTTRADSAGRTSAARRRRVRRELHALESSVQRSHGKAAVAASPALAPLLASLAACEAAHAELLSEPLTSRS